jgi:hypothetical protein
MRRTTSWILFLCSWTVVISSCKKKAADDPFPTDMQQTVGTDAEYESVLNETDDLALSALILADTPSGRSAASTDDRIAGATLSFDSTANRVSGSVTIDFGAGWTDPRGNTRIGKIVITWNSGRWFIVGSHTTITFLDYSINSMKFSNSDFRINHNVSSKTSPFTWTVEGSQTTLWPDFTSSSRTVHHTRQWVRASNSLDDKFIISQTRGATYAAQGTNRYTKSYSVVINTPLEYSRACIRSSKVHHPVKGVRVITYDTSKTVTLDFGSGTCDATFTASSTATTRTFVFKNDGSID